MTADEIQKLARRVYRRLGLSPEHVRHAKKVVHGTLAWHDSVLWGTCGEDSSRAHRFSVHVDLNGKLPQAMLCNCSDRLKPCVHAQALVMRAKDDITQFEEREPHPDFEDGARYDPTWE